jgi:radical SAM protein with 4Fe4S-binding SPASM domain
MGYKNVQIDPVVLRARLQEMASLGVKSIMFAGEGEPTLYKELPAMLDVCKEIGIDTSLTTNMVPFTEKNTETFVRNCAWIKVSINAGTKENYAAMHRTDPNDFDRVLATMRKCVALKKEKNYACTIGAQILLVSDNYHTVEDLVKVSKEIGLDYVVIKPYSQHGASHTTKYKDMDYSKLLFLSDVVQKYSTDQFKVVFRIHTIEKLLENADRYQKCGSVPFLWSYITAEGNVYGCSAYLADDGFNYGNIHANTFQEIWEGEKRKESYVFVQQKLNIKDCRVNCRMDEVNRYLWELTHPNPHVNFV